MRITIILIELLKEILVLVLELFILEMKIVIFYTKYRILNDDFNLITQVRALRIELEYCVNDGLLSLILETYSQTLNKS